MNDRPTSPPRGFQAKHRPMAEAAAIADAIVRRYGKRALSEAAHRDDASPETAPRASVSSSPAGSGS